MDARINYVAALSPEALKAIDATWRETGNTNLTGDASISRRFLSQRMQDLYADVVLPLL